MTINDANEVSQYRKRSEQNGSEANDSPFYPIRAGMASSYGVRKAFAVC